MSIRSNLRYELRNDVEEAIKAGITREVSKILFVNSDSAKAIANHSGSIADRVLEEIERHFRIRRRTHQPVTL